MSENNPFVGLRAFKTEESEKYKGYEKIAIQLRKLVSKNDISFFTAPSGIGKSSFINAEFIPVLRDFTPEDYLINWEYVILEPGERPVAKLFEVFEIEFNFETFYQAYKSHKEETLDNFFFEVSERIQKHFTPEEQADKSGNLKNQLLLIVDQFEEIFTKENKEDQWERQEERAVFIDLLLKLKQLQALSILLVGRIDYLINIANYNLLIEEINNSIVYLPPLPIKDIKSAIKKPLMYSDYTIDADFRSFIIDKIEQIRDKNTETSDGLEQNSESLEGDSLSLLQHYLFQLWNRHAGENVKVFNTTHGLRLGPLERIISISCDDVFYFSEGADEQERKMTKFLFQYISKQDKYNPKKIVRNSKSKKEIIDLYNSIFHGDSTIRQLFPYFPNDAQPSEEQWDQLIGKYTHEKLGVLRIVNDEIDITHESVFRQWFRCRGWIQEKNELFEKFHKLLLNEEQPDKLLPFKELLDYFAELEYFETTLWREEYATFYHAGTAKLSHKNLKTAEQQRACVDRLFRQRYMYAIIRSDFYTLMHIKVYNSLVKSDADQAELKNATQIREIALSRDELEHQLFDKEFYYALDLKYEPKLRDVNQEASSKTNQDMSTEFDSAAKKDGEEEQVISTKVDSQQIIARWEKGKIKPKDLSKKAYSDPVDTSNHAYLYKYAAFGGNAEYLKALMEYVYNGELEDPGIETIQTEVSAFTMAVFGKNYKGTNTQECPVLGLYEKLSLEDQRKILLLKSPSNERSVFHAAAGSGEYEVLDWLLAKAKEQIPAIEEEYKEAFKDFNTLVQDLRMEQAVEELDVLLKENAIHHRETQASIEDKVKAIKTGLKSILKNDDQKQVLEDLLNSLKRLKQVQLEKIILSNPMDELKDHIDGSPVHLVCFPIPQRETVLGDAFYTDALIAKTEYGHTPFYSACQLKNQAAIQSFLTINDTKYLKSFLQIEEGVNIYKSNYLLAVLLNLNVEFGPYILGNQSKYEALDALLNHEDSIIVEIIKKQLNVQSDDNSTVLHIAMFKDIGSFDAIRLLLGKGADPNILDRSKNSVLDLAVRYRDINIIKLFFEDSVKEKPNQFTIDKAAKNAFSSKRFDMYEYLCMPYRNAEKNGTTINPFSYQRPYVRIKFEEEQRSEAEVLAAFEERILFDATATWNVSPISQAVVDWTVLDEAAFRDEINIHAEMLKNMLYINPPIYKAARSTTLPFYDNIQLTELLIAFPDINQTAYLTYFTKLDDSIVYLKGTSPDIHTLNGNLPIKLSDENVYDYLKFFCSAVHGAHGAFRIIERVEDVHWCDKEERLQATAFLDYILKEKCSRPVENKVEEGWDCTAIVNYSNTLFLAEFLVKRGGMIEMKSDDLLLANLNLKIEVFDGFYNKNYRMLKEISEEEKLDLSFVGSAKIAQLELMKWLKATKIVDVNETNEEEETALHLAAKHGQEEVVAWLIEQEGINREQKNKEGKTALALADDLYHEEIISLLEGKES